MEEKKKFLLSRIKREQLAIKNDFTNFSNLFKSKPIKNQNFVSYIEHAKNLMTNNNTFALNLYQYLQRQQIETIFLRINHIFQDLLGKFKSKYGDYINLENMNNSKEIRQICELCHEQLQKNRISHIQDYLQTDNECKVTLLKNMIEQSKRQDSIPLFSFEQDKLFKQNLEKVLEDKERLLFTSFRQSDNFIDVVEKEITTFMVDFRNQLAEYQKNKMVQNQSQNWGKVMKVFLNKKLTNSFQSKMPSWIKKMQAIFMNKISFMPKPITCQKSTQTASIKSDKQMKEEQINNLKQKIKVKNRNIAKFQDELMKAKIENDLLKAEIQTLTAQFKLKIADISIRTRTVSKKEEQTASEVDIIKKKNGKKLRSSFNKVVDQKEIQNLQALNKQILQQKEQKQANQYIQSLKNQKKKKLKALHNSITKMKQVSQEISQSLIRTDRQLQQSISNQSKQQSNFLATPSAQNSATNTSKLISFKKNNNENNAKQDNGQTQKLKKKIFKRQNNEAHRLSGIKSIQNLTQQHETPSIVMSKSQLIDQVKKVSACLQKDIEYFNNRKLKKQSQSKQNIEASHIKSQHQKKYQNSTQITQQKQQNNDFLITKVKNLYETPQNQQNSKTLYQFNEKLQKLLNMQIIKTQPQQTKKTKLFKLIEDYFLTIQKVKKNLSKQFSLPIINKPSNLQARNSKVLDEVLNKEHKKKQMAKNHQSMHVNSERMYMADKKVYEHKNNGSIKFPMINQAGNKHIKTSQNQDPIFVPDIVNLFMDSEIAQQYENDQSTKHFIKPTASQFQKIEHIFSLLEGLNRNNPDMYHKICSFIKQPYTALKKSYKIFDCKGTIQFSAFCNHFMKIMWLHSNCKNHGNNKFCLHIQKFTQRLNAIIIVEQLTSKSSQIVHVAQNKSKPKESRSKQPVSMNKQNILRSNNKI